MRLLQRPRSPGIIRRIFASEETLLTFAFIAGLALLTPMITVPFDWRAQAALGAGFVILAIIVNRSIKAKWVTFFLMALSLFTTARYAYWRAVYTLGIGTPGYHWFDLAITGLLFLAEVYAWVVLVLGYLQTAWPLQRMPAALPENANNWPTVDVFIPTYNEDLSVVRPTVLAALAMDWPPDKFSVFILDDGVREEFRNFATDVGAGYITRAEHTHAKAGNLNHALKKTQGEFIAIFDCDHVPTRSFLQVTMGLFPTDPKLGLVQTPHHFYSPDPFERNLQVFKQVPNEGDLFYGVVQDGNDLWNASFFCGSCAVMRRTALEEIGGIATETVTEDAHTSLKFQRKGWNSAYLNVPQAAGLATDSFAGHVGQRIRWARGMAQIMRVDNPLTGSGLKSMQRLCYLNAMLHFFFAVPRLIFLTAPLLYLYFGVYVINAYALAIAAYAIPHLMLATIANSRVQGRHRNSFWNEVYETALAPYIALPTLLAVINPKLGKFNVTAKGGLVRHSYYNKRFAIPFIVLFALNFGGLIAGGIRWYLLPHASVATIVMTSVWTIYNLIMISVVLGVNWETRQIREAVRIPLQKLAFIYQSDKRRTPARTTDLSEGGVQVISGADVDIDESVVVSIAHDKGEFRFPAILASKEENVMRFQFGELNNEQYDNLVRILYGRADAWIGWGEARTPDRPWRSLLQVTRLAVLGVTRLMRSLFTSEKEPIDSDTVTASDSSKEPKTRAIAGVLLPIIFALTMMDIGLPTVRAATVTTSHMGAMVHTWTLSQLGDKNGLRLTGVDGIQSVVISVPPDRVVGSAHMMLRYHVSPGLLPHISQINILLNGQVVRSLPVEPGQNEGTTESANFSINPNLFTQYNHIGFQLIGHYTNQCENPDSSTLWATISPKTTLQISGARLALSNNLKRLPAPFFYKSLQSRLTIPFVFFSQPGSTTQQAAGVVASWFGDLASYRGSNFPVLIGAFPASGNAIVFATSENVPPIKGLPTITGPTVVITANPNDPYGKILWVLGTNSAEIVTAARALVLGSAVLDGPVDAINKVVMPAVPKPDTAPRWVPSSGPVMLSSLAGYNPMTVTGTGTIPFTFYLPPSLFLWNQSGVPIKLHYGYNSIPIAPNSTLNIATNGVFVHGFNLPPGRNHQQRNASVTFPASVLNSYANAIAATFYFVPIKGKCTETNIYNATGSIYPNSSINISGIPHYVRMPNLSVWMNGGYPFTRYADLSQTAVVMPNGAGPNILHTYLNMMGLLGEETGYPGIRLAVVTPNTINSASNRNLLVLTTSNGSVMDKWGPHLPITYSENSVHINNLTGWFNEARWELPWWNHHNARYGRTALGKVAAEGGLPNAILEEAISPLHSDKALLVLAAHDENGWSALRHMVYSVNQRKDVFGNLTIVHGGTVSSFNLQTRHYYVGHLPVWTWIQYRLSNHPWIIWIFVVLVTLTLAYIVAALLRRTAALRLRNKR